MINYNNNLNRLMYSPFSRMFSRMFAYDESGRSLFIGRLADITLVYSLAIFVSSGSGFVPALNHIANLASLYLGVTVFTCIVSVADRWYSSSAKNSKLKVLFSVILLVCAFIVVFSVWSMYEITSKSKPYEGLTPSPISKTVTSQKPTESESKKDFVSTKSVTTNPTISSPSTQISKLSVKDFDEDSQAYVTTLGFLMSTGKIEDFESFLSAFDELALQDPSMADMFLGRALTGGASTDEILELLSRGAEFRPEHLSLIASSRSLEEIKKLENYGLNVSLEEGVRGKILADSLLSPHRDDVFGYFVRTEIKGEDGDFLIQVLDRSEKLRLDGKYAKLILNSGGKITDDVGDWLRDLKLRNPSYYEELEVSLGL